jgi:YVTN family beta-propeller protein
MTEFISTSGTARKFVPDVPFILLGHNSNPSAPFPNYDGSLLKGTHAAKAVTFGGSSLIVGGAVVAGFGLSRDGKTLVAANFEDDSISIVDTASRTVNEIKFFTPGGTVAQGEFPYDVKVLSNDDGSAKTAFVTSQRDDQVMVDIASGNFTAIPVGDQPNRMALSRDQRTLYVVNGNSDTVSVIDTATQQVVKTIPLSRPGDPYKGADPNSAALSPDERTLYVTLGFENAIAVVGLDHGYVRGRIPTGWYPTSVSARPDGSRLYVCTFKRIKIIGSQQNGPEYLYEALDYVAEGKVKSIIETYPLAEAAKAYERVADGKARFRAVLTM